MKIMRGATALLVGLGCVGALAQQPTEGPALKSNGLVFMGPGPAADAHFAEMRKRLTDPVLRKQLAVETRAQMQTMNPDIAEVLGLDEHETAALLDLLTQQQMKHLDTFYAELAKPHPPTADDFDARSRQYTEDETRKNQEIKALLGDERFDRYLDYQQTRFERMQVARFDARLAPADKLSADQKQRLMTLVRTQFDESMGRRRGLMNMLPRAGTYQDMQAAMQKNLVESMENDYRQMREDSRTLLAKLSEVLTPTQVAEYAKMEDEKIAAQRKYTAQRRVELGLSPDFPEGPPTPPAADRVLVPGQVHLEVYFRTNDAEPVKVAFDTENGKPAPMFDAHDGLWVEMTPMLYQDGWANVDYQCYEDRNGQRRKVGGKGGTASQMSNKSSSYELGLGGGGGGTILGGSKGYSIRLEVRVTPVP